MPANGRVSAVDVLKGFVLAVRDRSSARVSATFDRASTSHDNDDQKISHDNDDQKIELSKVDEGWVGFSFALYASVENLREARQPKLT
jgi:hypothetical protein